MTTPAAALLVGWSRAPFTAAGVTHNGPNKFVSTCARACSSVISSIAPKRP